MPLLIILALLIIWPIAELYVMIEVARWIGFFWMLLLLFASAVSGMLILRHRGRVHWQRFRGAVSARRPPAREAFDGVMITAGAFLLIIPGFLTSLIGALILLPPTRFLARILLFWLFASRFRTVATAGTWTAAGYRAYRGRPEYDVEGEAVDVTGRDRRDDDALRRLPSGQNDGERRNPDRNRDE